MFQMTMSISHVIAGNQINVFADWPKTECVGQVLDAGTCQVTLIITILPNHQYTASIQLSFSLRKTHSTVFQRN